MNAIRVVVAMDVVADDAVKAYGLCSAVIEDAAGAARVDGRIEKFELYLQPEDLDTAQNVPYAGE